jgi:hypothetical protein
MLVNEIIKTDSRCRNLVLYYKQDIEM